MSLYEPILAALELRGVRYVVVAQVRGREPVTEPVNWDGGWDAHRRAELRAWRRSTPEQRLAWLESAIEFARSASGVTRPSEQHRTHGAHK